MNQDLNNNQNNNFSNNNQTPNFNNQPVQPQTSSNMYQQPVNQWYDKDLYNKQPQQPIEQPVQPQVQQPTYQEPVQPQQPIKPKKNKTGLIIGIVAIVLVIIAGIIFIPKLLNKEGTSDKPSNNASNLFKLTVKAQSPEKINDKYYIKKGSVIENDYIKLTITKIMKNENDDAFGELLVYGNLDLKMNLGEKSYKSKFSESTIKNDNYYQLNDYLKVYQNYLNHDYMIDYESGYDILDTTFDNKILKGTYNVVFPAKINDNDYAVRLYNKFYEKDQIDDYTDFYILENSVEDYVSGYEISNLLTKNTEAQSSYLQKEDDVLTYNDEKAPIEIYYLKYKYNIKLQIPSSYNSRKNDMKAISFTNGITVYLNNSSYVEYAYANYDGTIDKLIIFDVNSEETKQEISIKNYILNSDKINWK